MELKKIYEEIFRDYLKVDYEFGDIDIIETRKIYWIRQNIKKIRRILKLSNNLEFSNEEEKLESLFFSQNGVREINIFKALYKFRKSLYLLRDNIERPINLPVVDSVTIELLFIAKQLEKC